MASAVLYFSAIFHAGPQHRQLRQKAVECMEKEINLLENDPVDARRIRLPTGSLVLTAFMLSGMASLIYQVVWLRPLQIIFGSSIFSVSTILVTFLGGFVLGSYLFRKIADKSDNPLELFASLEFLIGIYGIFVIALFGVVSYTYLPLYNILPAVLFTPVQFLLMFAVLIIPTTLMGATWPVATKAYVKSLDEVGKGTAHLYSFNSFGSGIGSMGAGFLLMPVLGVSGSIVFAAAANLLAAALVFKLSVKK